MAESSKSIMLYLDTLPQWKMLTDQQAGILIKALLSYAQTGEQLCSDDGMLMMAFSFIAAQIDRDSEKYESKCERNRRIAQEREERRRAEREQESTNVHERARTCTNVTYTDTNTETDTNTDTERETDTNADKPRRTHAHIGSSFVPPSVAEVQAYCKQRGNGIDAQRFVDYHASIGWILSGNPIRDWKAVVRKWESTQTKSARDKPPDSSIDMEVIEKLMHPYAGGDL